MRIELWFQNRGYVTIPKNTPVSFYDNDPAPVKEACWGNLFCCPMTFRENVCRICIQPPLKLVGLNWIPLVTVFNDNGTTIPLNLPNTGLQEVTFNNNINIKRDLRFRASLDPAEYTLQPTEQVVLEPVAVSGGDITSATWETSPYLSWHQLYRFNVHRPVPPGYRCHGKSAGLHTIRLLQRCRKPKCICRLLTIIQ